MTNSQKNYIAINNISIVSIDTINNGEVKQELVPSSSLYTMYTFLPHISFNQLDEDMQNTLLSMGKNKLGATFFIINNALVLDYAFKGTIELPYEGTGEYEWRDKATQSNDFTVEKLNEFSTEKFCFIRFKGQPRTAGFRIYGSWLEKC